MSKLPCEVWQDEYKQLLKEIGIDLLITINKKSVAAIASADSLIFWFFNVIPCRERCPVEVQMGFMRLLMLMFSLDFVDLCSLAELGSGLMKTKRNAIFNTLHMGVEYPSVVADPCLRSGFAAAGDVADL